MILHRTNGTYNGEENSQRDIRLRHAYERSMIHMHIQHPEAMMLGDPVELTAQQAREIATTLCRLADALDEEKVYWPI